MKSIAPTGARARTIALAVVCILMLCWAAFANGQPFVFNDTSTYLNGTDYAVERIVGFRTEWTDHRSALKAAEKSASAPQAHLRPLSSIEE